MNFNNNFYKLKISVKTLYRQIIVAAVIAAFLLLVPILAMLFTEQVNWTAFDYFVAWILLFGAGSTYVLIAGMGNVKSYRIAAGIAVGTALIIIWSNLAVGIIGSEENPVNLLFYAVLLIGITGSFAARFKPWGMSITLFVMAIAQALVPAIALLIRMPDLPSDVSTTDIFRVFVFNSFFVILFILSALLFRSAAKQEDNEQINNDVAKV
ncbi:MAG: hypothetical protein Kow0098_18990 [Ignavibacteriaceae bacterium]